MAQVSREKRVSTAISVAISGSCCKSQSFRRLFCAFRRLLNSMHKKTVLLEINAFVKLLQ